jgi:hypothetical protein
VIEPLAVSPEEKAELRRNFEFGAYLGITQYLAKRYGFGELHSFAEYWAELAAEGRRGLIAKSQREFMKTEAKVEKVWVEREVVRLDDEAYVGVVDVCPLRKVINANRDELPEDYFCDNICAVMYPEGYRLLGLETTITKSDKGCRLEIDLKGHQPLSVEPILGRRKSQKNSPKRRLHLFERMPSSSI